MLLSTLWALVVPLVVEFIWKFLVASCLAQLLRVESLTRRGFSMTFVALPKQPNVSSCAA